MTTLIQKVTNWGKSALLGVAHEKTGVLPGSKMGAIQFVDRIDGTVTDTHTGLTWMRCALGQTWDGRHCTGAAECLTWDQAMALTHTFAGHNDWRVPNIDELQNLIESARNYRSTYMSIFPNAPNAAHWSSSPSTEDHGLVQSIQLPSGRIENSKRNYGFGRRIRLVRGGKSPTSSAPPTGADMNSEINKSIEIARMVANSPKTMSFGEISNSNGNLTKKVKIQAASKTILSTPKSQEPQLIAKQGTNTMTSATIKNHDIDTLTPLSSQQGKLNRADLPSIVEAILKRLDLLETRFHVAINRIEIALAPITAGQLEMFSTINQLQPPSSADTNQLTDEITGLRLLIERQEIRFDASISRIEMLLKSLFQTQAAALAAMTPVQQTPAANTEILASEIAELRQVIVLALQAAQPTPQTSPSQTTESEPIPRELGNMSLFLAWLLEQDVIPLSDLRIRLLPLDLLPSAVVNDINERALDLTGEPALAEDGDNVIVQREVLFRVIAD